MSAAYALLGGTFDPIHLGHLRVAYEAAEALDAVVHLMPANVPPHRPQPRASAAQRLALIERALAGHDRLRVDARELRRAGPSYTVDTLRELRAELGAGQPIVLLLGADAYAGLPTWHEWRTLFDFAHIAMLTRPGHEADALSGELAAETARRRVTAPERLHASPAGCVLAVPVTALEISATRVRALLAAGREPRFLVPGAFFERDDWLAPYRRAEGLGPGA